MKQYVYDFYGENELEEVIDRFRQERREKAGLFITLYHESNDLEKVKESIQTLRKAFPQSAIAGMSASGGIKDGRMVLGKSVVAFLSFEDTEVSVHCYDISSMTPRRGRGKGAGKLQRYQKSGRGGSIYHPFHGERG